MSDEKPTIDEIEQALADAGTVPWWISDRGVMVAPKDNDQDKPGYPREAALPQASAWITEAHKPQWARWNFIRASRGYVARLLEMVRGADVELDVKPMRSRSMSALAAAAEANSDDVSALRYATLSAKLALLGSELAADVVKLLDALVRVTAHRDYLKDREARFVRALAPVSDSGQYRADVVSAVERVLRERDAAQRDVARADKQVAALRDIAARLVEFAEVLGVDKDHPLVDDLNRYKTEIDAALLEGKKD